MTLTHEQLVEIMARAICTKDCADSDEVDFNFLGGPSGRLGWHAYEGVARAVLTALSQHELAVVPREATQAALRP